MKRSIHLITGILVLVIFTGVPDARSQDPVTIASFSTTNVTTGLCAPATVEFQVGNWFNNSPGTRYVIDFGDGSANITLPHPLDPANTTYLLPHTYTRSSCPADGFKATLKVINGTRVTNYTLDGIMVRQKPVVDFGVPPTCTDMPVCFTNQSQNSYIENSCSIMGNFAWDFGDGTTSNAVNPPCHTYTTAGTYNVTLQVSNTACGADSRTKQITVRPLSAPPVVTAPPEYCQEQTALPLTATGTGLLWYTAATGGVGSATAPTPSTTTAGIKTYYVSQTLAASCESPRVPVAVTIYASPARPVVSSPKYCQGQTAVPLTATGTDLLWYTSIGGTGSSTAPTPSTDTPGSTIYYVSQSNSYGCKSPLANSTVVVHPVPAQPLITTKTSLCVGDDLILQVQPAAGLNYVWTGPGIDFAANTPSVGIATVKPGDAGRYTVTVTSAATGCSAKADTMIEVGNFPVVKFPQDTVILPAGNSLNLVPFIANADKPGVLPIEKYEWTPSEELTYRDPIHASAVAVIRNDACYTVTATNKYGCSGKDELCVKIRCRNAEIFVPGAFTPAGPVPENRTLMVRTASNNRVKVFRVFNRWGKIVFERYNFPSNDPAFGWDGKYNGKPADTGVYIYMVDIICENGTLYSFKGNTTLL